jgi:hypothetical protein
MKKLPYLLLILFFTNCKKQDTQNSTVTPQPTPKDYLKTSYELRKNDLWFDFNGIHPTPGKVGFQTGVAVTDFNADGYDDILLSYCINTYTLHPLELYLNDKKGGFIRSTELILNNTGLQAARKAIVGDYNGDKKPDVFFADHGAEIGTPPFPGYYISILLSEGNNYRFKVLDNLLPKNFYHGACSGDVDKDGDLDIFLCTGEFLINDGKSNFTVNKTMFNYNKGGLFTTEMIDIDNDGYLDLLIGGHSITDWEMKGPTILWGNGKEFSESNSTILPGVNGWGVSVDFNFEDLDGDAKKEILVNLSGGSKDINTGGYNPTDFYQGYRIQVLKNNGNRQFVDKTTDYIADYMDPNTRWIVWLMVGDADKNGKKDIYAQDKSNNVSGKAVLWEYNGGKYVRKFF